MERLEREKESEKKIKLLRLILDCEGWQRNENEFAVDIIHQWHELLEYAKDTIGVSGKSYMVTWSEIFASPRSENWRDILTLIELLLTIPISNATLERMFSKLRGF